MAALEAQLANVPALQKISVKFDIADCGSAEGVNFCQRGVDEDMPSLGTLSCDADPANDCVAKEFNLFDSGALIGQDKMEELLNGMTINGVKFIEDAQGPQTPGATGDEGYRGFNVTLTKELSAAKSRPAASTRSSTASSSRAATCAATCPPWS